MRILEEGARAAQRAHRWHGGSVSYSPGYPLLLSTSPLVILSEAKDLVRQIYVGNPSPRCALLTA